jgi:hypothetical protein
VFDFNPAKFAQLVVNGLAVAGGFLLGWVLAAVAGLLLDRWLFRRRTPPVAHKMLRLVGGVAVAVLVALIVFGHGQGWTLFGGGLDGSANGTGPTTPTTPAETKSEADTLSKAAPPKPAADAAPAGERIRVTMLGGADVKDQRFYLVEDDPTPRTLAEVKAAVLRKKESTPKKLAVEIRFAAQNTLPQTHPAVLQLANWAGQTAGLTVTFPADGG